MQPSEPVRKALAAIGGLLFLAVSTFPLFGGAAKRAVRCRGREFTGNFDDCFNDYLPILELLAPVVALLMLWPFLRFAFTLWAPDPEFRSSRWRLASSSTMQIWWPQFQIAGIVLAGWCFYRAVLYPLDALTAPFQLIWLVFAIWTIAGLAVSWPAKSERID